MTLPNGGCVLVVNFKRVDTRENILICGRVGPLDNLWLTLTHTVQGTGTHLVYINRDITVNWIFKLEKIIRMQHYLSAC